MTAPRRALRVGLIANTHHPTRGRGIPPGALAEARGLLGAAP